MPTELNESEVQKQSKLNAATSVIYRFLQPDPNVHRLCQELGYQWREHVYTPMITVWMFILQTLSADKSYQHAVNNLNAWRVTHGLAEVSSMTTAFCKARVCLPEALLKKLLSAVAKRCEDATDEAWLWCVRIVEMDAFTLCRALSQTPHPSTFDVKLYSERFKQMSPHQSDRMTLTNQERRRLDDPASPQRRHA